MERCQISRADLAKSAGLPYKTLSNYATDINPPDIDAVRRICAALPENERSELIAARAADEVPSELRHLVFIQARTEVVEQVQQEPFYARKLPCDLRAALDRLAKAGIENPEWKAAILALAELT